MQKTVKQICEEQGILGQIVLEKFNSDGADILIKPSTFEKCVSTVRDWQTGEDKQFWKALTKLIREKELKPKSLAEQHIESSGLRETVEKMQVLAEQPSKLAKEIMNSFEGVSIEPTKSISKGSIVTIDGKEYELQGDAVLVKHITELIQGKRYLIGHSLNFCHSFGSINRSDLIENQIEVYFVGMVSIPIFGERFIFYNDNNTYFMFTKDERGYFDFIVKQLD